MVTTLPSLTFAVLKKGCVHEPFHASPSREKECALIAYGAHVGSLQSML
jgi:hypothetical protein